MKKIKAILSVLLIIVLCLGMASCGNKDEAAFDTDYGRAVGSNELYDEGDDIFDGPSAESANYKGKESLGAEGENITPDSVKKKNLKLIYRADLYLQTLDFDKSMIDIEKLVNDVEGFFENRQIDHGSYYRNDNFKNATFIIRVPSDKYQAFLDSVSGSCHVVSISQNIEDIGDAYYDTENRIRTLEIKEERLQTLLSKATKMSDIIELESALSENEYTLEMYKSQLRNYDSLVDYSTITVTLESVEILSADVNRELNFGEKLAHALKTGASDFLSWLENLAMWFGYNILKIVLIAVIAVVLVRFRPVSKLFSSLNAKRKAKKNLKGNKSDIAAPANSDADKQ